MKAVEVRIEQVIVPRVLPCSIFVSWKGKGAIGNSEPVKVREQVVKFNAAFGVQFEGNKEEDVIISVNTINKNNQFIKFSDSHITINESTFQKASSYVQRVCTSSIGDFIVVAELKPAEFEEFKPKLTVDEVLQRYGNNINSIVIDSTYTEKDPDKYIKSDILLRLLTKYPRDLITQNHLDTLNEYLAKLQLNDKKIDSKHELYVKAINSLLEKDLLYISSSGDIKSYGAYHNKLVERFPLIAVIICQEIQKMREQTLIFNSKDIDNIMIEVCSMFSYLIGKKATTERLLYLACNIYFLYTYLKTSMNLKCDQLNLFLIMTYKQLLCFIFEQITNQLNVFANDYNKIARWQRNIQSLADDLTISNVLLNDVYGYLSTYFDRSLFLSWLQNDQLEVKNLNSLKQMFPGEWIYMKNIEFIKNNLKNVLKQKYSNDQISPYCQGSVLVSIMKKFERCKLVSLTPKDIEKLNPSLIPKNGITPTEFIESISDIPSDVIVPSALPNIKE